MSTSIPTSTAHLTQAQARDAFDHGDHYRIDKIRKYRSSVIKEIEITLVRSDSNNWQIGTKRIWHPSAFNVMRKVI